MNADPLRVLDSLGSICEYRTPEKLVGAWAQVQEAMEALQVEFAQRETERDRFLYALDVLDKLLLTARMRANWHELRQPGLACENVDMFQLIGDWIEFVRKRV